VRVRAFSVRRGLGRVKVVSCVMLCAVCGVNQGLGLG
jgi:hypothetical protein